MSQQYRMTALTDYSNGAIPWPAGQSSYWPKGEARIVPAHVWDRIVRDGVAKFDVKFYTAPVPEMVLPDPIEPAAAPDKRTAALAKARAAKAAKKAAAQADKD